eukprot:305651_1
MELPDLQIGWGPTEDAIPSFSGLPFTPFSKRDTINYVANWDPSSSRRSRRSRSKFGDDENANQLGVFTDSDNDEGFEGGITVKKRSYETIAKYRRDRTGQQNKLNYSQNRKVIKEQQQLQNAPTSRRGTRRQVQNKRRRKKYIENPRPTCASIKKQDHWIDLTDIWFRETFEGGYGNSRAFVFSIDGEELIGSVYTPSAKKLIMAGTIHGTLTKYDTRHGNTYKPEMLNYEKFSDFKYVHFSHKSAIQDPYIFELANRPSNKANVFTTDNVLSAIMCCNRSKYSFDIVINKIGDKIFLDERNKVLSTYSVDETSQNRPTKKGTSKINQYTSLAQEATYINHVFAEQMVYHTRLDYTQKLKRPHPFVNEIGGNAKKKKNSSSRRNKAKKINRSRNTNQEAASQAFSYNLYEVTDNIKVICRCAIDGYLVDDAGNKKKRKDNDWVKIYALNQYDSNRSKTQNWTKYLDTRDSTILSQEITNNNFKCARFGIKAHLSGANYIKLGFVTRDSVHSTEKHLVCGVKTYQVDDFIRNKLRIRSMNEPWTIFAKFVKCVKELEHDGRYIAVRDPLKQVIRMFKVNDDSFTKDDGLPSFGALKKMVSSTTNNDNKT